jgi:ABC-2 type transport system permease protein
MYVVFVHFLRFGAGEPHYAVSLLLGIVLWNYFIEVTMNGMSAIVGKGDLMRKLSFPRYVIVVAGSFSAIINLAINLVIVGILIALNGVDITPRALLVLPVILELFVLSLSIAFILAALYVKLRDVNYIWELLLQVGFYATPILYPISLIQQYSDSAAKVAMLNPLAQIVQDARHALVSPQTATTWRLFDNGPSAFIPIIVVLSLLVLAIVYFKHESPDFAENV